MPSVKTAVSLPELLFGKVEAIAHDMNVSRSRLFTLALEEFVQRYENKQLLDKINAAYQDIPDSSERAFLYTVRRRYRQIMEDEW